jgi:membrane-associated phospholipid phosphatase
VNLVKAPVEPIQPARPEATVAGFSAQAHILFQRTVGNLARWIKVLISPRRTELSGPSANSIAVIVLALIADISVMFLLDSAAISWASHLPAWFNGAFEEITDFGLGVWFLVPFGFIVLCLAALTSTALPRLTQGVLTSLAARFGFLFLAIGAPGLFVTIVKRLIGRARPYVGGHDDPFAYMPLAWRPEYASMPSGHATNAAAAAIAIGAVWPRARLVMWLYAVVIMFSRVVVMAHHPSDVIAGAIVGVVGASLVRRWFAARLLVFSASDLTACPGPSFKRIKTAINQAAHFRGKSKFAAD